MSQNAATVLPATQNRRENNREAARAPATIVDFSGARVPVTIIDYSVGGARIETPSGARIPARFNLVLDANGTTFLCEFIWRKDAHVGVQFLEQRSGIDPRPEVVGPAASSAPSVAALRSMFATTQVRRR